VFHIKVKSEILIFKKTQQFQRRSMANLRHWCCTSWRRTFPPATAYSSQHARRASDARPSSAAHESTTTAIIQFFNSLTSRILFRALLHCFPDFIVIVFTFRLGLLRWPHI